MEWLFLLIPIIASGLAKYYHPRRVTTWEVGVPILAGLIAIFVGKMAADHYATSATEYWGGYLVQGNYYEHWNERVSCRHTKYCTRTVKGKTESYPCGTEHSYDVDDHPPYWEIINSNGENWRVPRQDFENLAQEWGNRVFIDMNRSYHTIDGDCYRTNWNQKYENLHPTVTEHSYENRIAASNSVLNYREVPEEEKKQYALFEYPRTSFFCTSVLGYSHPGNTDLDKTNALIARANQVRIWLLCFKNQPLQAAYSQEAYWKRGNKNELVICTSLDAENKIQWSHVFSWTDREELKIHTRQWIEDRTGQVLDVKAFNDFVKPLVEKEWTRKEFAEFSYIAVEPPGWAYVMILVVVIGTTVGTIWWAIANRYTEGYY